MSFRNVFFAKFGILQQRKYLQLPKLNTAKQINQNKTKNLKMNFDLTGADINFTGMFLNTGYKRFLHLNLNNKDVFLSQFTPPRQISKVSSRFKSTEVDTNSNEKGILDQNVSASDVSNRPKIRARRTLTKALLQESVTVQNKDNEPALVSKPLVSDTSNLISPSKPNEFYYNEPQDGQLAKSFPNPKNTLHNVYDLVARETKKNHLKVTPRYKPSKDKRSAWICSYQVHWPEEVKFLAADPKKKNASHKAALAALSWLRRQGRISKEGAPLIETVEEIKTLTRKTVEPLVLDENLTVKKLRSILDVYEKRIVKHLDSDLGRSETVDEESNENEGEENSWKRTEELDDKFKDVKSQRFLGLDCYLAKEKVKLPIAEFKNDFIKMLTENQVLIVKGEPGCGKSTRVPQYVLETWAREQGSSGNRGRVVVTQPRRIAAISLAERVASERDEMVGDIVGYQVRLKSNFKSSTGRILYCTTGILLRHLQSDSNLTNFTHVVLDEAHERDVNTDLLMNLLRTALKKNPSLKLIVMSATIDTEMFSDYFDGAPILDVPGFTFPVKQHFLDDCRMDVHKTVEMSAGDSPTVVHEDVVKVIEFIHRKKKEGAILCFLPGWEDIAKIQRLIPVSGDVAVYCLHSRLQDSEQWKIFSRPPPGVRKIILSTNIAETSVTIDDVVYVVDTGIHKEQRFDIEKGVNCIDSHWISKASATQRKGRAGRVRPGECFHLYPSAKHRSLPDYSLPDIHKTSLTKIVLDSKVFSNNMDAVEFMRGLPTPPEEGATRRAVEELKELDLLDGREKLTSLGRTVADFQLEPKLGKALVNSVVYKCATPVVDIVTLFSGDSELFTSGLINKEDTKRVKGQFSSSSDHLAMMRIFEKWLEIKEESSSYELKKFCQNANLVPYKMDTLQKLRKIHFDYLRNGLYDVLPISDDFSDNDELVKAVIYSGIGTHLQHRNWDVVKNRFKNNVNVLLTRNNHKATVTMESVNFKRNKYPSNYLLYINETRSNVRRTTLVRECSLIPKLSVLLFSNKNLEIREIGKDKYLGEIASNDQVSLILENTKVEFICDRKQAELLMESKKAVTDIYRHFVRQLTDGGEYNPELNESWNKILTLLGEILRKHAVPE